MFGTSLLDRAHGYGSDRTAIDAVEYDRSGVRTPIV